MYTQCNDNVFQVSTHSHCLETEISVFQNIYSIRQKMGNSLQFIELLHFQRFKKIKRIFAISLDEGQFNLLNFRIFNRLN